MNIVLKARSKSKRHESLETLVVLPNFQRQHVDSPRTRVSEENLFQCKALVDRMKPQIPTVSKVG